jgi:hypothetical protein
MRETFRGTSKEYNMDDRAIDRWLNVDRNASHFRSPRPLAAEFSSLPLVLSSPSSGAARFPAQNHHGARYAQLDVAKKGMAAPGGAGKKQMSDEDLAEKVAQGAEDRVGKPAFKGADGKITCFDLPDHLLTEAGGKSADDFEKVVTGKEDQDYKWGLLVVDTKDIKRGDIVQFRDHIVTKTITNTKDGSFETEPPFYRAPRHSAIVIRKNPDGTLEIAEQHVMNHKTRTLSMNVEQGNLPLVPSNSFSTDKRGVRIYITIEINKTGKTWFYHPVVKKK